MLKPNNVVLTISPSLLLNGVPREDLYVYTLNGMTVWRPDGSVRAPRLTDDWRRGNPSKPVLYVNLIPR